MARKMKAGATSQTIYVEVLDSTSTTGGRKTGLAYNTASLVAYYVMNGGSATAITLATLAAANSAWSSGGFKEVDATNMPGIYRLDVPDAAIASGPSVVITIKGATGMVQVSEEIQLEAINAQDAVRLGLTALPNAAAEAAGGLYTRGSGAGQINQQANGQVDSNVARWLNTAVSTPTVAGVPNVNAKTWNDLATVELPLVPTTAGRKLDVSTGGEAGVDWANVGTPGSTNNLSATTIKTLTDAPSDSSGVTTLLSRVPSGIFSGITSLAHWIGMLAGKQAANATALTEIKASGAGSGTYDPTTDSLEANRDNIGTAGAGLTAADDAVISAIAAVQADTDDIQTRIPAALGANGNMKADLRDMGGVAQSATDLKDFADTGYDPATHKVAGVVLTDTLTTYTGNTPQTGDAYAKVDTEIAALQASVDDIPTNAELATALGTADDATLAAIAALNNLSSAQVATVLATALTTAVADSVPADGSRPSIAQAAYMTVQFLLERLVSGTTVTIYKPDGTTPLFTLTLNDGTTPTAITRAT